jgi:hypothetical protein
MARASQWAPPIPNTPLLASLTLFASGCDIENPNDQLALITQAPFMLFWAYGAIKTGWHIHQDMQARREILGESPSIKDERYRSMLHASIVPTICTFLSGALMAARVGCEPGSELQEFGQGMGILNLIAFWHQFIYGLLGAANHGIFGAPDERAKNALEITLTGSNDAEEKISALEKCARQGVEWIAPTDTIFNEKNLDRILFRKEFLLDTLAFAARPPARRLELLKYVTSMVSLAAAPGLLRRHLDALTRIPYTRDGDFVRFLVKSRYELKSGRYGISVGSALKRAFNAGILGRTALGLFMSAGNYPEYLSRAAKLKNRALEESRPDPEKNRKYAENAAEIDAFLFRLYQEDREGFGSLLKRDYMELYVTFLEREGHALRDAKDAEKELLETDALKLETLGTIVANTDRKLTIMATLWRRYVNTGDTDERVRIYRDIRLVDRSLAALMHWEPGFISGEIFRELPDEEKRAILTSAISKLLQSGQAEMLNEFLTEAEVSLPPDFWFHHGAGIFEILRSASEHPNADVRRAASPGRLAAIEKHLNPAAMKREQTTDPENAAAKACAALANAARRTTR